MEEKQNGEAEKTAAATAIEPSPQGMRKGEAKQKGGRKKYVYISLLLLLFLLLAAAGYAYYRGVVYYGTHFLPNTDRKSVV